MEFFDLVAKAESVLNAGQKLPLRKVIINEEEMRDALERMKLGVPEEFKRARQLESERDTILSTAEREARRTQEAAEEEFRVKLQDSHVVQAADKRAREIQAEAERQGAGIIADAEKRANARKGDADQYAKDVLQKLDATLTQLLTSVRKGITSLEKEGTPRR